MNGYLRVNTFLRDVAFINCQNIKTVYFHVKYFETRKGKYQATPMLLRASLGLLRDVATRKNKKLLGGWGGDYQFSVIMHTYVTAWGVSNDVAKTDLHIYSSNRPGLYKEW